MKFVFHQYKITLFSLVIFFTYEGFAQLNPLQQDTSLPVPLQQQVANGIPVQVNPKDAFKTLYTSKQTGSATIKGINTEHLSPMAYSFVQDYINRHADGLKRLRGWAGPYFNMMDEVLTRSGIPKELKYLAVIESNLRSTAVSWAGAVGPWQFMPETGRNWGLIILPYHDERQDYLKSTYAACRYLNYLYSLYKDWLLVVAAYNCGPGRVNSAISRSGSRDFWRLQNFLPVESRDHVKKFIATHYIMEGQGSVATVTKDKQVDFRARPHVAGTVEKTIIGRFRSTAIAKYLAMSIEDFNKLNPALDKTLASNKPYLLMLPMDKVGLFDAHKNEMLNESIQMLLNPDYKN